MANIAWTPQEDAILMNLWMTVSAGEIATQVNRTREAVIGRAHRLNLANPGRTGGPHLTQTVKPAKPVEPPQPEPISSPIQDGVAFMDILSFQCRAIVGYDTQQPHLPRFCGEPTRIGSFLSYCPEHLSIYTSSSRPRTF